MNYLIYIVIGIAVIVGAVLLVVSGIRKAKTMDEDPLAARLAEYSQRGDAVSLEEIELSQPFTDRVIMPIVRRLGDLSSRFTPQHVLEQTRRRLELAGNPGRMDASTFLVLHFVVAGLFGGWVL